jgi:hypothetical protein
MKEFFNPKENKKINVEPDNDGIYDLFFSDQLSEITEEQKSYYDENAKIYDDVAHLSFDIQNEKYKVYDCEIVDNSYLNSKIDSCQNGEVILNYENKLLIKSKDKVIKLKDFNHEVVGIKTGIILESEK